MKLFVGNLSFKTTEEEVLALFSEYGRVKECILITERATGKSRGFAFVTFADPNDAEKALEALDNSEYNGRRIGVEIAKQRPPAEPRHGRGSRRG